MLAREHELVSWIVYEIVPSTSSGGRGHDTLAEQQSLSLVITSGGEGEFCGGVI